MPARATATEQVGDIPSCVYGAHVFTVATDDRNPERGQRCACGQKRWNGKGAYTLEVRGIPTKAPPEMSEQ